MKKVIINLAKTIEQEHKGIDFDYKTVEKKIKKYQKGKRKLGQRWSIK